MKINKLLIFDSNFLFHRSKYASFKNDSGIFSNTTLFYFLNAAKKIIKELNPNFVVFCWDSGSKIRKELYPEYKENRKGLSDTDKEQMDIIKEGLNVLGFNQIIISGVEADDLIYSIIEKVKNDKIGTIVYTSDNDFYPLLNNRVIIYSPTKDKKIINKEDVEKEKDISVDKLQDIKCITGETGDRIPGIKGIGFKTARELIKEFGYLDDLLNNIDKIKKCKIKDKIKDNISQIIMNKDLVGFKFIDFELDLIYRKDFNIDSVYDFFNQVSPGLLNKINDWIDL